MNHVPESGAEKLFALKNHLPRYGVYSDFPPTLLSTEENNWASPSSHDGAAASLATTHKGLRVWGVLPKNSRIQRAIPALRGHDTKDGWAHPGITLSHPQAAPSLIHPLCPNSGRKKIFSEVAVWPLQHMPSESSYLSVFMWEQLLEKHQVLSAGKSKLFMWVPLWLLSYSLCSEMQPGSSLKSSLRLQFSGSPVSLSSPGFFLQFSNSIPRKRYAQTVINSPDPCLPTMKYTELPPNPSNTFF